MEEIQDVLDGLSALIFAFKGAHVVVIDVGILIGCGFGFDGGAVSEYYFEHCEERKSDRRP